ncbi:MAG: hypothetical protein ACOCTT_03805, partial [archaeon]
SLDEEDKSKEKASKEATSKILADRGMSGKSSTKSGGSEKKKDSILKNSESIQNWFPSDDDED